MLRSGWSSSRAGTTLAIVAGVLGAFTATSDAAACSYGVPNQAREVRCEASPRVDGAHTSIDDADFTVAALHLQRTTYPPVGSEVACTSPSELALQFQWGDAEAWPSDIGLLLTVEAGDFPWFEPAPADTRLGPGWLLAADAGEVRFFGFDEPYEALDVTVAARAIDCAGAVSLPLLVRIDDPGLPEPPADGNAFDTSDEASAGCALQREPAGRVRSALLGIGIALVAARRARRRAA